MPDFILDHEKKDWEEVRPQKSCSLQSKLSKHAVTMVSQGNKEKILGSLRNYDSNSNATNQWFDWLNEEK